MFAFKLILLYHQDLLMNFNYIWLNARYRFKILLREIPVLGLDFEVKITDLQYSHKSQTFYIKVYIALLSRTFD